MFGSVLTPAENAGLPQGDRTQAVNAVIIQSVLISCPFRARIPSAQLNGEVFREATRIIRQRVAGGALVYPQSAQIAIHFVAAGVDDFGFRQETACGFEYVECTERIALKVVARIGQRSDKRNLSGKVQDYIHIAMRRPVRVHLVGEPHVQIIDLQLKAVAEVSLVVLCAAAVDVVRQRASLSRMSERGGGVGSDESGAARDQPVHAEISFSAVFALY